MMPYVDNLPEQQRENFLHVLAHVVFADGHVDQAEKDYIAVAAKAYNLTEDHIEKVMVPKTNEETLAMALTIEGDVSRRYLVREMLSLAYADGNLDKTEKDIIYHIGTEIGVSPSRMNEMLEWAIDSFELQIDGISLVEKEDNGREILVDEDDEIMEFTDEDDSEIDAFLAEALPEGFDEDDFEDEDIDEEE